MGEIGHMFAYVAEVHGSALWSRRTGLIFQVVVLVADERGEYAYCPREEQQRRIKFLKQNMK